ncbi:MAG TPA: FHA domain-containing protein [Candidatus Bathyarchaeia archaeon]|nr:FHA domain-containing protein [Candidatus Bathyarchaeia archaeon]
MSTRHSKSPGIESENETNQNWKCASCGAENEDFRQFCDGCGDPRPGAKIPTSGGFTMDELLAPKESTKEETTFEPTPASDQDKPLEMGSDNFEDKIEPEPVEAKPLPPPKREAPTKKTKKTTRRTSKPSTVLTGTFGRSKSEIVQTFPAPLSTGSTTGQHYSIIFVNSPASSLLKSRVSIDFDDFPTITIGRSPENVVVVPDQEVSRKHAELTLDGDSVMLKDLNSSNGTFLYNGKEFERVSESVEVKPNSIIKFGTGTIVRLVTE